MKTILTCGCLTLLLASLCGEAATLPGNLASGDKMLAAYFQAETARLADGCLAGIASLEQWDRQRAKKRQELFEMLGLAPLPERTELRPAVTGKVEEELFTVEKLHFQSLPGFM
jgi:hypothetical protein